MRNDFENDHALRGRELEDRVAFLLREIGFVIEVGRPGMEDLLAHHIPEWLPKKPLAIEVKSSSKAQVSRGALRQLDDWVFDLSGEETIRKGIVRYELAFRRSSPLLAPRASHPTPHKGVLVYNGPVDVPFRARPESCLGANELAFARKRDLCVVTFAGLLEWSSASQTDGRAGARLWNAIHACQGMLARL